MIFQRARIQFPASTWQVTTVCTSNARGFGTFKHICRQNPNAHKIKIIILYIYIYEKTVSISTHVRQRSCPGDILSRSLLASLPNDGTHNMSLSILFKPSCSCPAPEAATFFSHHILHLPVPHLSPQVPPPALCPIERFSRHIPALALRACACFQPLPRTPDRDYLQEEGILGITAGEVLAHGWLDSML